MEGKQIVVIVVSCAVQMLFQVHGSHDDAENERLSDPPSKSDHVNVGRL